MKRCEDLENQKIFDQAYAKLTKAADVHLKMSKKNNASKRTNAYLNMVAMHFEMDVHPMRLIDD